MSLRLKAICAALLLLVGASSLVGLLSFMTLKRNLAATEQRDTEAAVKLALSTVKDIGQRMVAHAVIAGADPAMVEAVSSGDSAYLGQTMPPVFKRLVEADKVVAVMEVFDRNGKIVLRGHNPSKFGDDKSKEPSVKAALAGKPYSALTVSPTSGEPSWNAAEPLRNGAGEIIGGITVGARLNHQTAEEIKAATDLDIALMSDKKLTAVTFAGRKVADLPDQAAIIDATARDGADAVDTQMFGNDYLAKARVIPSDNGHTLSVVAYKDRKPSQDAVKAFLTSLLTNVGLFLLVMIPLAYVLVSRTMARVTRLTAATTAIANGALETAVPQVAAKDEVGELARAVKVFQETSIRSRALEDEAEVNRRRLAETRRETMAGVADDLERMIGSVTAALGQNAQALEHAASGLDQLAERAMHEAATASNATRDAAGDVETVAAASQELQTSIDEISQQLGHASQTTNQAVGQAESVSTLARDLGQKVTRINDVVELINAIASQTNLLALNATIEAARAGELGKGFAVVAQEVKQLANQTAKATEEINAQIGDVRAATEHVVVGIDTVTSAIGHVNTAAGSIAAAVEEQNAATGEISRSITGASDKSAVAQAAGQAVSEVVTHVKTEAETLKMASTAISAQTAELSRKVGDALQQIRAA